MQTNTVLVCGAGIAGPTLVYWLKRAGFTPTLLERAPALRSSGYVIDFWGLGYDIAEKMGLLPQLLSKGYHVTELRVVDSHGERVSGFGTKVFDELTARRFVSIKRSDLSQLIFANAADGCEVLFGDTIKAIYQEQDGTRVTFEHRNDRRFDLVIGADGLHSAVRRLAFGPQENYEKHLGYTVAAFEVSGYRPRDEDVYVIYEHPGRQIGRFALRGDRTLFLFVFAHNVDQRSYPHVLGAQKAFLRDAFTDNEWELLQILAALDSCTELYPSAQISGAPDDLGQMTNRTSALDMPSSLADAANEEDARQTGRKTSRYIRTHRFTHWQHRYRYAFHRYAFWHRYRYAFHNLRKGWI